MSIRLLIGILLFVVGVRAKDTTTLNKADVLVGNIKYEFKSWTSDLPNPWNSFFSPTGTLNLQLKRYLQNTDNFSNLKYIFNGQKVEESIVKTAFKEMLYNSTTKILTDKGTEVFETIWGNQSLRGSLFGIIPENQLDALYNSKLNQFSTWVDELNPKIYNFIKAE